MPSRPVSVRTAIGWGGWVNVEQVGKETLRLLVRVTPDDAARLRIVELYLGHGVPITAEALRTVRLGAIEDVLNSPAVRAGIMGRIEIPGIDLSSEASRFATISGRIPPKRTKATPDEASSRRPLRKPKASRYSGSFYRDVAATYRAALVSGNPPAPFIAREAKVPLTTAARWIKRARELGYLGPTRRGRAGEAGELELRYVGIHDAVRVPVPGGEALEVQRDGTVRVPIDHALRLLEQESNWVPARGGRS